MIAYNAFIFLQRNKEYAFSHKGKKWDGPKILVSNAYAWGLAALAMAGCGAGQANIEMKDVGACIAGLLLPQGCHNCAASVSGEM